MQAWGQAEQRMTKIPTLQNSENLFGREGQGWGGISIAGGEGKNFKAFKGALSSPLSPSSIASLTFFYDILKGSRKYQRKAIELSGGPKSMSSLGTIKTPERRTKSRS